MAKQTQTKAVQTKAVAVVAGSVPRGVIATNGNTVLVSTHRRQYVVVTNGKAVGYFTASQAAGHTNAMQRFYTGTAKLHPVKATHTAKLAAMGKLQ